MISEKTDRRSPKKLSVSLDQIELPEPTREQLIEEFKEALEELKAIGQGKKQARPLADLLNEL